MDFFNAEFLASCGFAKQLPAPTCGELVFCGRSNVGKSSLINKLCNRKSLARVSATPGKTTTINFFSLGDDCMLVDLPGYGYAKRPQAEKVRWAALMEYYFSSQRNIRLALLLLDSRHAPSSDDIQMLEYLRDTGRPFLAVLTKTDKLKKSEQKQQIEWFSEYLAPYSVLNIVPFSINGSEHAEKLRTEITSFWAK